MLAKLVICAWSLHLGLGLHDGPQAANTADGKVRLVAVRRVLARVWSIVGNPRQEEAEVAETETPTPTPAPEEGTKVTLVAVEKSVIEATNARRAEYGLPPLEVDEDLMKTARDHCSWMTNNETLRHTRLPVAENIAMGQDSPEHVLSTWMGSSGHRANILNGAFRRIGVAAYQTPRGVIFWCQQFELK